MPDPILLYPDGTPNSLGETEKDRPRLFPFPMPAGSGRGTVLVIPGGGYQGIAPDYEGADIARFFNSLGLASFVLHYRVAPYKHPAPLQDAVRAMRIIRSRAQEFGVDPKRVATLGFSAGGHLTGTLSNYSSWIAPDDLGDISGRPDAAVLCYPVLTFDAHTHKGSVKNLLGENPDPKLFEAMSLEKAVSARTPPTFMWHTVEDPSVPVENVLLYAAACRKHGVPFELHVFPRGRHGLGFAKGLPAEAWANLLANFLRERGFVE